MLKRGGFLAESGTSSGRGNVPMVPRRGIDDVVQGELLQIGKFGVKLFHGR